MLNRYNYGQQLILGAVRALKDKPIKRYKMSCKTTVWDEFFETLIVKNKQKTSSRIIYKNFL